MISQTRDDIMGMPITVTIVDKNASQQDLHAVFLFFQDIDNKFSTYKKDSEISQFNRKEISEKKLSYDMQEIFALSEQTKKETNGFFDIRKKDGTIDPSGLVKGWAIEKAAQLVSKRGFTNFYIDAGGDIQTKGCNKNNKPWVVGIRNPFNRNEIVKVIQLHGNAIATSGTYIRGQHVYNPHKRNSDLKKIISVTVVGPNIYEADRFATAAFAMQEQGIYFLERQKDLEGYMINKEGIATFTSGFGQYVKHN